MPLPEHVVVLAFENRSFDHYLGFLPTASGGDLSGNEQNPLNPADPSAGSVRVTQNAGPITRLDPDHSFQGAMQQLFGGSLDRGQVAPMDGFVASYTAQAGGDVATGKQIMDCHSPASLPVLSALAQAYCLCTRWFSSLPGPTWPNRFFMHAATSRGLVTNGLLDAGAATIFDRLDAAAPKRSWRVYAGDLPQCLAILRLAHTFVDERLAPPAQQHFHSLDQFFTDLQAGALPDYAFLEPNYFDTPFGRASDQHPPHDVRVGEALLAHVYNALLDSPCWATTLLLVLFDEHGGFYDSVPPPAGVPAPDALKSVHPAFDFTRLGVRVPAVAISPLIPPGPDATQYDHSSIPATLNAVFGLGPGAFLSNRDAHARTLEHTLTLASSAARTDATPLAVPLALAREALAPPPAATGGMVETVRHLQQRLAQEPPTNFSEHQRDLLALANSLAWRLR